MLNRFEYTPDHEKDWQKQDRETGPLSGFQEEKQEKTQKEDRFTDWPEFKRLYETHGKPEGKINGLNRYGVQVYYWGDLDRVRRNDDGRSLILNFFTTGTVYIRNIRTKYEDVKTGLTVQAP